MNYSKSLISSFFLIFLTGCSTTPISSVHVAEKEVIYITIPDEFLTPCKPDKPLKQEEYLKLDFMARESYLTDYSIHLLEKLKECNLKISKIKNLNNVKEKP